MLFLEGDAVLAGDGDLGAGITVGCDGEGDEGGCCSFEGSFFERVSCE